MIGCAAAAFEWHISFMHGTLWLLHAVLFVSVCDAALLLLLPDRLLPVSVLLLDLDLNRMVVGGGNVVKVWDLKRLLCIAEFEGRSQVRLEQLCHGMVCPFILIILMITIYYFMREESYTWILSPTKSVLSTHYI